MFLKKTGLNVIIVFTCTMGWGQVADFHLSMKSFYEFGQISDSVQRNSEIEMTWNIFHESHLIPFIVDDSVAFLYRGEANSVEWVGDFNGWGSQKDFDNQGKRMPGTDLWILKCSLPNDARLDYKIVLNHSQWILDPENPYQQWTGLDGGSPNSELRMHEWEEDPLQKPLVPEKLKGSLTKDVLFKSRALGYSINYSVYLPYEFESIGRMPILYVIDGNEYMQPALGNMITVLDNLILKEKIEPIIVVFLDPREPTNKSNNRRMQELNMNAKYLKFLTKELIPAIDKKYPTQRYPSTRAVLGTSMGGLAAAYVVLSKPDIISMAGIQSPAFHVRPEIYELAGKSRNHEIKVSMTSGRIHDTSEEARKMCELLEENVADFHYRETNEGHSWGNWKNLIDDILIDFFGI